MTALVVPEVELAVTVRLGPHGGGPGLPISRHLRHRSPLALEGPIREYYRPHETGDDAQWRTEIVWPIFDTGRA